MVSLEQNISKTPKTSRLPQYYGQLQPMVQTLKGFFAVIALALSLLTLFGDNHDVRGFYSSLFLSSSPVLFDLMAIYKSIRYDSSTSDKVKTIFAAAYYSIIPCFMLSIILLLAEGKNVSFISAYLNGRYWGISILLFPFIIYSFIINIIRPLIEKRNGDDEDIEQEERA